MPMQAWKRPTQTMTFLSNNKPLGALWRVNNHNNTSSQYYVILYHSEFATHTRHHYLFFLLNYLGDLNGTNARATRVNNE